jgi:uncharacterized protein (TIGR00159 family)
MLTRLWPILKSFQIQDILDIAIITVMISALLIWFKDRASRFVLFGIGVLGLIYILARFFQLYLTTLVLQGFFAIFLFVIVVIFQEDLRRFFERLALWGRFKISLRDVASSHSSAEIIAHTAANLARQRIGALMVIAGNEPLDRHLTGGVRLDGLLSEPLLESIFDPHSKGHDGAIVIRDDRIELFGCHLPLTSNIPPHSRYGLRHTAALGLSERSDALCIVVSEERGTLSLAQGEQLNQVENASDLRSALEDFYARNAPPRPQHPILAWLKENPKEKVIAFVLAIILWLTFGYQRDSVRRDFTAPIEYVNLAPDWVLEGTRNTDAVVTLTGSSQAFRLLNPERLKVSIDLAKTQHGKQEISLTGDLVTVPPGLTVVGIKPERITITASRFTAVTASIEAVVKLPSNDWIVERTTLIPSSVRILIPYRERSRHFQLKTEPISLHPTTDAQTHTASLIMPAEVRLEGGKIPEVTVNVKLKKRISTHPSQAPRPSTEITEDG